MAKQRQAEHNDDRDDPMPELLRSFLDMKLPPDWNTWDLNRRRAYIKNPDPLDEAGTETRTKVCAAEFICEYLGINITDKDYKYKARKVFQILRTFDDWEESGVSRHASCLYGRQKAFSRKQNNADDNVI